MDQGDFEQRLQVPTGSKRPSPSPTEGEEDREIKKFRTQLSNGNEDWGFQSNEPGFPFTDFPSDDFFGNELGTFWSNQDVHGMSFNTVTGLDMGYDGSAAFTTIHTDYGTNLGDGLATAALNVNPDARAEIGWRGFSHYPYEGSESHVDRHDLDGGVYADQHGDLITGDYGGHNWIDDIPVSQSEALVASHDSPSGIGALKSVESIPIRRSQGYESPAQSLAASSPKESVDVRQDCDTCFGVVTATPTGISSLKQEGGMRCIPVDLESFGPYFILRAQPSGTHAGILDNSQLLKILAQFTLRLDATLLIPETKGVEQPLRTKSRNHNSTTFVEKHRLRIAVHGFKIDKEPIGKLLSDADFFLQHPSAAELLPDVEYDNPHYLLRPGAKMPRIEDLSMEIDGDVPSQAELEDEARSGDLLRIFESAALAADGDRVTHLKVTPSPRLRAVLMVHQRTALAFMLEKESGFMEEPTFPSLWTTERSGGGATLQYRHTITRSLEHRPYPVMGGILADDMGLGKTLSMLALICSSLDLHAKSADLSENQNCRRTLIIAPKSTIHSWEAQASRHVHEGQLRVGRYHGPGREELAKDLLEVEVVITTYETLRSDFTTRNSSPIYSCQWLRVVLDEAHHVRNRFRQTFFSVCQLKARYRWCLTGTPVHNSLDDYGALLSFVRVYPFRAKSQFMTYVVKPLEEDRHKLGIRPLQALVRATCLRRTKQQALESGLLSLPRRTETTCPVYLHPDDQILYDSVKTMLQRTASGSEKSLRKDVSAKAKEKNVVVLLNSLRLICNHGAELVPQLAKSIAGKASASCIDHIQGQIHVAACLSCGGETDGSSVYTGIGPHGSLCVNCASVETTPRSSELQMILEQREGSSASRSPSKRNSIFGKAARPSAKVVALINNLRQEASFSDQIDKPRKSVIFSYWVKMLDLIEEALRAENMAWQRIDGQTSLDGRRRAVSDFSGRSDCTVMLASIGSAAEGIDLTAASIVHLIEPHWNPMVEAQAVDRVYRIGQMQEVTVIRYIVPDSVETYVQVVQQEKMNIINQTNNTRDITERELTVAREKALEKVLA